MITTWYCCRQRAGPLVKECRALRPRFGAEDTAEDHKAKSEIKKYTRCAVNRKQVDRLELRLALMGPHATHYRLSFDNEHLPADFKGVRRALRSFLGRASRWLAKRGRDGPLDYIYCIEGLHGERRYHIHFVCDYYEICPAEMRYLWKFGDVEDFPVLDKHAYLDPKTGERVEVSNGGYRRLAEYFNKERPDGFIIPVGRHPWSCSKSLNARLSPPERWTDTSGIIEVPDNVLWARRGGTTNDFGAYYYGSWIETPRATN